MSGTQVYRSAFVPHDLEAPISGAPSGPLAGLTVIHRYGMIRPGERIVLALAAARHRGEAFSAAEFMMDYLKTRAPFWKKTHRADGAQGDWVEAKAADDSAAARWAIKPSDPAR